MRTIRITGAEDERDMVLPRGALLAAAALVLFSLFAATMVRFTGVGGAQMTLPPALESRQLRFADAPGGAVLVTDAATGRTVDTLAPGSNGFVRVVLRGLARERRLGDIGPEPAFLLTRHVNGQLTLTDPATGRLVDLAAFGAVNADAFARLLTLRGAP
jgi:putative photosynthetic complex assembly protein